LCPEACPRLKAISQAGVDGCVVLELAEEGVGIVAEEDVGAYLPRQVVVDLVVDVRPQVSVLVGPARCLGEFRQLVCPRRRRRIENAVGVLIVDDADDNNVA